MSPRRLHDRLTRLELAASTAIGQDPVGDRIGLVDLEFRRFSRRGLNNAEELQYLKLRQHVWQLDCERLEELEQKLLTDGERAELAQLQRFFAPNRDDLQAKVDAETDTEAEAEEEEHEAETETGS